MHRFEVIFCHRFLTAAVVSPTDGSHSFRSSPRFLARLGSEAERWAPANWGIPQLHGGEACV
jgi:hypothetical protein